MEDLTGKQLGPYQIIQPLGEGGMAAVYKAFQASVERYVALKILPRHFASDPEFVARFSQEARVIANLQHPHILPVHDFGEADGYTYLVMRFVEGGTLSDWLRTQTPLSLAKIRKIISQVGGALDYAHAQGVIHRDIKPSNILVDKWDNCLLTDFGLAKIVAGTANLTQTGGILGTPAYMSPEQGLGKKIDHRSDIYSLGVVLYQMAVGHLPYQAETPMAVVVKHIHDPLPPPRQKDPNLPESVERVILRALNKNPEDRYPTVGDMVKALESATEVSASTIPSSPPALEEAVEVTTSISDPTVVEEVKTAPAPVIPATKGKSLAETTVTPPPVPALSKEKGKSKLPWILGGVGFIVVLILLIAIFGGFFSDEEDGQNIVEDPNSTAVEDVPEDELRQFEPGEVPHQIDELLMEVEVAYGDGDIGRARGLLDEAIGIAPEMAGLYCQRGYASRDLEAFPEAVADFERCLQLAEAQGDPDLQAEALGMMAFTQATITLMETDDPRLALNIMDEALNEPSAPDWLYCERGEFNTYLDDTPAAIADFKRCQSGEDIGEYWELRSQTAVLELEGSAALEREDYPFAIENFNAWTGLDPENPWAFCYLGEAHLGAEELEEAMAAFEHCREINDGEESNRWAETSMLTIQANVAETEGDMDAALGFLHQAVEIAPDEAGIYCERGRILMVLEAFDEARANYQTCLDLSEEGSDIRQWAEEMLHELEDAP